jgi:transposase
VKVELFALRQQWGHYRRLHRDACEREKVLKEKVEELEARLRQRERELFAAKSERRRRRRRKAGESEATSGTRPRRRGHPRGARGHGRLVAGLVARNVGEKHWHADETGWRVFVREEGKAGLGWWLWVFAAPTSVVFVLDRSRGRQVPETHLAGAEEGVLVVDRWPSYPSVAKVKAGKILLAFCWGHVRRDFLRVARDWPGQAAWGNEWLDAIGELFALNALRRKVLGDPAAFAPRDEAVRRAVERLAARREEALAQADLHPARRRALESLRGHWKGLTLFVGRPEIAMDNNEAERQLRGPVVGRKTFYGSGALWAGELAAALFSLFATLKRWGLNPRRWLTAYLEACATHGGKPPPDAESFLPWNLSETRRRELAAVPPPDT